MNCARARDLTPLHAGGDLSASKAEAVTKHLRDCESCALLAREYEESREWLKSIGSPEFDRSFHDGVRSAVLAEIQRERISPRGGLIRRWRTAPALGLMGVILAVVIYAVGGFGPGGPTEDNVADQKRTDQDQNEPSIESPTPEVLDGEIEANVPVVRRPRRAGGKRAMPEPDSLVAVTPDERLDPEFGDDSDTLRIEIQTEDPEIRIIWFARRVDRPEREADTNMER